MRLRALLTEPCFSVTSFAQSHELGATTKRGTNCRAAAMAGSLYCVLHSDPKRAAELGRMGGRQNRHCVETEDVISISAFESARDQEHLVSGHGGCAGEKAGAEDCSTLTYMAGALLKEFETTEVHERLARFEADMQNKADKQ